MYCKQVHKGLQITLQLYQITPFIQETVSARNIKTIKKLMFAAKPFTLRFRSANANWTKCCTNLWYWKSASLHQFTVIYKYGRSTTLHQSTAISKDEAPLHQSTVISMDEVPLCINLRSLVWSKRLSAPIYGHTFGRSASLHQSAVTSSDEVPLCTNLRS